MQVLCNGIDGGYTGDDNKSCAHQQLYFGILIRSCDYNQPQKYENTTVRVFALILFGRPTLPI